MRSVRLEVVAIVEIPIGPDEAPQEELAKLLKFGAEHPEWIVGEPSAAIAINGKITGDAPTSWPQLAARKVISQGTRTTFK